MGDVEFSDRHFGAFDLPDEGGKLFCERQSAGLDAEKHQAAAAFILFDDLMRHAFEGTAHIFFAHEGRFKFHGASFRHKKCLADRQDEIA